MKGPRAVPIHQNIGNEAKAVLSVEAFDHSPTMVGMISDIVLNNPRTSWDIIALLLTPNIFI